MPYVDGFILAVPKANLDQYKEMARVAGNVWREYGALSYVECLADDVPYGEVTSFPRAVLCKEDEIVVFSWITYPSRETRDEINKKVMADPRLDSEKWEMPFDGKRMIYGGFQSFLDL
ncbi:MAG: RNA signal recognition particle [Rhizobium sp. 63-7]|nr:MAG: RNA signal recognition particle [Rhizobium sp. 63-7]